LQAGRFKFASHGWHRQELPVAEGREVFFYNECLGNCSQKSIYPFGHRQFLLISLKSVDIKPVGQLLLLLLRNPGNKLPGLPDAQHGVLLKVLINVLLTIL
jgi:hypothetical protein